VAKDSLLKFRQKGFLQKSRETFDDSIVEECYTRNLEYWRYYEMWQLCKILAPRHTIMGAHHALELCIYVEHKGCIMALEFKFGTCVKTT
jgi:hypothetical protein